jgi:ribulose-5-phosphate 4-epimerase/fuculose-1-phosphate aldolase
MHFQYQNPASNLSSESPMHQAIHDVIRPLFPEDDLWVIHSHVPNTVVLSVSQKVPEERFCITHCLKESGFSNRLFCVDGQPGSQQLAENVKWAAQQVVQSQNDPYAVLLKGHGLVTFGSVSSALQTHVLIEHMASILVKAPAAYEVSSVDLVSNYT